MIIHNKGSYGKGVFFITPGSDHPEVAAWRDERTKLPYMLTVRFVDGAADVTAEIGRYMLEKGYAFPTPNH